MEGMLLALGLLGIIAYLWYVSLVKKRHAGHRALSGIDVQINKRLELVLTILEMAKKIMGHEKTLLADISLLNAQAIKSYDIADAAAITEHLVAAEQLNDKMSQLMDNVEAYPELKSNNCLLQAMQAYNEVEAHISTARRFYNAAVTELNKAVEIFPGSIIASMVNIQVMPFDDGSKASMDTIEIVK